MRLIYIQPAIGHRPGKRYMRSWQMEPLPIAALAGLTPAHIEQRLFDDRVEAIPYDAPADLVALTVETYSARRSYQIADEFRKRGVKVVLGGFHPTLMPDEAQKHADAIVIGEAEAIWEELLEDAASNTLKPRYAGTRENLSKIRVDRRIFQGKRYLPIGLIETGRGCRFPCEFCAVQTFFERSYRARPTDDIIQELHEIKRGKKLFFFVDDNFAGDIEGRKALLDALVPMKVRWITQMSIHAAHNEAFVASLYRAGCRGALIGFESLDQANLQQMGKRFNVMGTGYDGALRTLARHGISVYGTFVFGYDHDTLESFDAAVDFALAHKMYLAGFNHLMPFPGTPLYQRLAAEKRIRMEDWWLNPAYRYNTLPFVPKRLEPEAITQGCISARRRFYSWRNILKRAGGNARDFFMWRNFFPINAMHHFEIDQRDGHPLGDSA